MKTLTEFINEQLEIVEIVAESEIKSESDFRKYAEDKFKEAFGDELDENKMNDTIEGILNDNKELVEAGEWGELIGILNKSF